MLRDRGLTMVATAHSAKLKADRKERYLRLQDQILGSTALFGFTDTQMYLASPEELQQPYYAFVWAPHASKPETFQLGRDEQGLFVPYEPQDEGNCTRVLELFPASCEEPITLAALTVLAADIPLSLATLKRVLEVLIERQRIARVKRGIYVRQALH